MGRTISLGLLIAITGAVAAEGASFSVDPASPSISGGLTPDDVLVAGPAVATQGSALGLQDNFFGGVFDNLNALSFGRDSIGQPLFFSVDRVAVGASGSDVNSEAGPGSEEASGDVFRALPPSGSNVQVADEQTLGLTPGFFGDDLDALSLLPPGPNASFYFSIDDLSASGSALANDVLLSAGGGSYSTFADGVTHIGLATGDDLDALVLNDVVNPGTLDPGVDMALFSISTFSSSSTTFGGAFSPADVLFTDFTGSFSVYASATSLGLRTDDELNALATVPLPVAAWPGFAALVLAGAWRLRRR